MPLDPLRNLLALSAIVASIMAAVLITTSTYHGLTLEVGLLAVMALLSWGCATALTDSSPSHITTQRHSTDAS